MSFACLRLSCLGLVLAVVAGCGGGSGGLSGGGGGTGSDNSPTTVTFRFEGSMPTAVAARTGSGPFTPQTLSSGVLTLPVPRGITTFALAYVCEQPAYPPFQITGQTVHQLSVADGDTFTEVC